MNRLLWVDDEIEHLKAHIIFLQSRGYEVETATNGLDALDLCRSRQFDIIFLDENMPGLSGLETLTRIKATDAGVPVVMVTKSEEENIMDQAIGAKIADYLIKPVNPNQIVLTLKKHLHKRALESEAANTGYRQEFTDIGMSISDCRSIDDWKDVYRRLVRWELELADTDSPMSEMLLSQKAEANQEFGKFVARHYTDWVQADIAERPYMSPDVMRRSVFPALSRGEQVYLIVFDNLRYDQWRVMARQLADDFTIDEQLCLSILPTATQYARNAIFSGLLPLQSAEMYPSLWVDEDAEEGKNLNEEALIGTQMARFRRRESYAYTKLNHAADTERYAATLRQSDGRALNVVVVNFIDMLSHARTESSMVRELAADERAYRAITATWFRHSAVRDLFAALARKRATVVITTDHGSIRVAQPTKVVGDRNTSTNLRYKLGRNLSYNARDVYALRQPRAAMLPAPNLSSTYIFATGDRFLAYPTNYNYYVAHYRNTFQHGGVSLEEMLIPLATLQSRHTR